MRKSSTRFRHYTLKHNELTGIDCRMEAEHRSLVKKSLLEDINEIKKIKEQEFNCLLAVLFHVLL